MMSPRLRSYSLFALQLLLVGGVYFVTARWGLNMGAVNEFASLIWPPTGIALAALFLFGYRLWPAIAVAAFFVNYTTGAPLLAAAAIGAGNAAEALVGTWLLQVFRFNPLFNRLIDSFTLIIVAFSATIISATVGTAALASTALLMANEVPITWLAWWIGDGLGVLILMPFLVRWLARPSGNNHRSYLQYLEAILFLVALIVTTLIIFWEPIPQIGGIIARYMLFVPLTWGALRVGPRIMSLAIVTVAALAIIGTFAGTGPYATSSVNDLFLLQLFLSTVAFIFLLFVAAVEERKEAIRKLEANVASLQEDVLNISEADRAKNDFIATLSHELRNPLAPILSTLEIMRMRRSGDAALSAMLDTTHENVMRMTRLLDDLLDVARISRKKISLQMGDVSLKNVIAHSSEMTHALMEKNKHTLVIDTPDDDITLRADELRLEQILVNLLNNAAKYTPTGGQIALYAAPSGNGVEIRVRDNGIGIPAEELQRIFEPFKQINRGSGAAGLGIGLSLAKRLVELHGGRISAVSRGAGLGSEFIVWLPAANPVILLPAETKAKKAEPPPRAQPRKQKRKVLIVDDNATAAKSIAELLNHSGHEARAVFSGAEALQTLAQFAPDIVFLDIGLPNESGYDVARTIRSYLDPTPILIALTGYGQDEDRQRAIEAGFDHHLVKPVSIADLEKILASV
jgi:two-component system, sensor histidine kinase